MCFFNVKHSIGHISGIVGPIDVKRQDGAPVGYWVNYVTSTLYLIPDLDLWFFKVKFQIAVFQELLSNWCETKRKQISYILGWLYGVALWPHPWPWPWSFKVKVWNSLIWGMGGLIDMEWGGCESIIHDHDHDLWVTMVGGVVDVPDLSDWGDFRRRRAVDTCSWYPWLVRGCCDATAIYAFSVLCICFRCDTVNGLSINWRLMKTWHRATQDIQYPNPSSERLLTL